MAKKKTTSTSLTLQGLLLILAIVGGALAGVIASVTTDHTLEQYAQSLADRQTLLAISQEKPRPLPGTYEEALAKVQEDGWSSTAIVKKKTVDSLDVRDWITQADSEGVGTVITSDGWILFDADSLKPFANPQQDAEIWVEGVRYDITDVIVDTLTNYALVNVEATALSTLAFGSSNQMLGGDLLFVLTNNNEIIPTSLHSSKGIIEEGIVLPAEKYSTQWSVVDPVEFPSPILNAAGEFVGFSTKDGAAIPFHQIRPFIQSVLRYGDVRYAGAGFYSASVGEVLNIGDDSLNNINAGAYVIAPNTKSAAVLPGSPAAKAGLQEGDVIIAVDDVLISKEQSIADLLKSYEPGMDALFTILRDGTEVELNIAFVSYEDLVY